MVAFLIGLVGVPCVVLVAGGIVRWRRDRVHAPPGSRAARWLGCTCSGWRNWFGAREAVRGTCVVASGCPVLAHRPERVVR